MTSKTELVKEHMDLQNKLVSTQLDALRGTVEGKVLSNNFGRSGAELLQRINRGKAAADAKATDEAEEILKQVKKGYDLETHYLIGRASVGDLKEFYQKEDNALRVHDALVQAGQISLVEESRVHQLEYAIKQLETQRTQLYKELEARKGE